MLPTYGWEPIRRRRPSGGLLLSARKRIGKQKIAGTNRGYTRIYFMTNQFARDRSRAESEDTLTKKFGIPVVILDRTWITKAVL